MRARIVQPGWLGRWAKQAVQHIKEAPSVFLVMSLVMLIAGLLFGACPPVFRYVYGTFIVMLGAAVWVQSHRGIRGVRATFLAVLAHTDWRACMKSIPRLVIGPTIGLVLLSILYAGIRILAHAPAYAGVHGALPQWGESIASDLISVACFGLLSAFGSGTGGEAIAAAAVAANPDLGIDHDGLRILLRVANIANNTLFLTLCFVGVTGSFGLFFLSWLLISFAGWPAILLIALGSLCALAIGFSVVFMWEGLCEMLDIDPPRKPLAKRQKEGKAIPQLIPEPGAMCVSRRP